MSDSNPSPPELGATRFQTREEIFERARTHFLYRDRLSGSASFLDCPITRKQDVRAPLDEARRARASELDGMYWSPSGGSTSDQKFYWPTDIVENTFARACFAEVLRDAHFFSGVRCLLNMNAGHNLYRAMELFTEFAEACSVTVLPAGNIISDVDAMDLIDGFGVDAIAGPPTRLGRLAAGMVALERRAQIPVLFTASDKLHPSTRERLSQVMGTRSFRQLYGSAETGVWAYQPESLAGTDTFVYDPRLVALEVDLPDARGVGRLVVTCLTRRRMPVLRFDTGDVGRVDEAIVDGRPQAVFMFEGRGSRSFQLDGDTFELEAVDAAIGGMVEKYQLVIFHHPATQEDILECRVLGPRPGTSPSAIRAALATVCPTTSVREVGIEDLITTELSDKVLALVDLRF